MAIPRIYTDEIVARKHLEKLLWPEGPVCPHCGSIDEATKLKGKSTRSGVYKCRGCEKPFSVTVGTLFEKSKIPLNQWVYAVHLYTSSKKGFSAHQLHRMLHVTYKTAWFMAHRIRKAMEATNTEPMGGNRGPLQVDETYYGGTSKRAKNYTRKLKSKGSVIALVDGASGEARAFHVESADAKSVREILRKNATRKAILVTDESNLYTKVGREFSEHQRVLHEKERYVTDDGFTTNNVENFFGIFKRGMKGVYHFCGQQHLQSYLNEFSFRYSRRSGLGIEDAERAEMALKGIVGKRLTYRWPHNVKIAQA
jgi:transposase-like protein